MSGGTYTQLLEQAETDFPLLGAARTPSTEPMVDIEFHYNYPTMMGEYPPS